MGNNLDKLFGKALEEQRCAPPPHIWDAVGRELDRRRKRRGIVLWCLRGAAAVLIAIGSVWMLRMQADVQVDTIQLSRTSPEKPESNSQKPNASEKTGNVYHETINNDSPPEQSCTSPSAAVGSVEAERIREERREAERQILPDGTKIASIGLEDVPLSSRTAIILAAGTEPKDFVPIVSGEALRNAKDYHALLGEAPASPEKRRKIKVTVSGHVAPVYSSGTYSSSLSNPQGRAYSQKELNGTTNASGGLKVAMATSPRLSWQTGISYSRIGQRSGNSAAAPRAMLLADENMENYAATPLGNIKGRAQATAYRSPEAILLSNSGGGETEQDFGTLEIPLSVRYRLNDNKVRFFVSGGLCGNIVVSNKVYQENGKDRKFLGSTEDIRSFNVSTDFSIGAEYPLARRVKIMLEPGFKYFLQSMSRDSRVNFKPYLFSLSTGIGIEF